MRVTRAQYILYILCIYSKNIQNIYIYMLRFSARYRHDSYGLQSESM